MTTLIQQIREGAVELRRASAELEALNSLNTTGKTHEELDEIAVKIGLAAAKEASLRQRMHLLVSAYAQEENRGLVESLKEHGGHLNG